MTKAEQVRLVSWRLKFLQRAGGGPRALAKTCRHFGISRKTFYKWKQRHATHGAAGVGDQSRRPHQSPRATSPDVVRKILYLRQTYHFGPSRIAAYLARFIARR